MFKKFLPFLLAFVFMFNGSGSVSAASGFPHTWEFNGSYYVMNLGDDTVTYGLISKWWRSMADYEAGKPPDYVSVMDRLTPEGEHRAVCNGVFYFTVHGDGGVLLGDFIEVAVEVPNGECANVGQPPEPTDYSSQLDDISSKLQQIIDKECCAILVEISSKISQSLANESIMIDRLTEIRDLLNKPPESIGDTDIAIAEPELPEFPSLNMDSLNEEPPGSDLVAPEDDTVYFEDQGNADEPPFSLDMPIVPDPKDWEGYQKGEEGSKQPDLEKSPEGSRDEFEQAPVLGKSPEGSRDEFEQAPVLGKSPEGSKGEELQQGNTFTQTNFFEVSE